MKHDIQIHLKNEKEVFRLIRLLLFTFLFSAVLLGAPDYIWNMTLYRISKFVIPWLIAIPAIISLCERKVKLKDIAGQRIGFQILVGTGIGFLMALLVAVGNALISPGGLPVTASGNIKQILYTLCRYLLVVGMTEELIYRVAINGALQDICGKHKWIAPVVSNLLFAVSHLFQGTVETMIFTIFTGAVFTLVYTWKKGGYIMAFVTHGVYDFMAIMLPVFRVMIQTHTS